MIDTDKLKRKLEGKVDEYAIQNIYSDIGQMRFSGDKKDIYNEWIENTASIFASIGKREAEIMLESEEKADESIDRLVRIIKMSPENDLYEGLNPKKQSYRTAIQPRSDNDIEKLAEEMIRGSMDNGADRVSGLIYSKYETFDILTNYNAGTFSRRGTEYLIRSFKGARTSQVAYQSGSADSVDPYSTGEESARSINTDLPIRAGEEGKFDVIFSPYAFGNIMTYGSGFFSAYSVLSDLSCFIGKL
ncbi:MAG: hypothetical protein ACP5UV_07320, partial [Thermoplasmata archaeon]